MSKNQFSDHCPGCLPVIMDPVTHEALPDDHPTMVAMMKAWGKTTRKEREAFHAVMCQNSRTPQNVNRVRKIIRRLQCEAVSSEQQKGQDGFASQPFSRPTIQ